MERTEEQKAELARLRKAAFSAYADHERDMATDPQYRKFADRQLRRKQTRYSKEKNV